jgi:erythromycin esterase-like protein
MRDGAVIGAIHENLSLLSGSPRNLDPLIDAIGNSSYVLIGEASHGTHEFYDVRAEITKRLIQERGYLALAAEADWLDAHRIDRYVRRRSRDTSPREALSDFQRFPLWMWRNQVVETFIGWLRAYNDRRAERIPEVGFYGLDLYSMNASRAEVIRYLDRVDPEAGRRARKRYACFDHFGGDEQAYGMAAGFGHSESRRRGGAATHRPPPPGV